jgi:hypothetical protein
LLDLKERAGLIGAPLNQQKLRAGVSDPPYTNLHPHASNPSATAGHKYKY